MRTCSATPESGKNNQTDKSEKTDTEKKFEAIDKGQAKIDEQVQKAEGEKAEAAKPDEDKAASEQKPANVQQEEAANATNVQEPITDNTKAGDLNAAEGNEHSLDSTSRKVSESSSAASATQEGPTQEDYLDQDDIKVADTTDGPVNIRTTDDQDVGAVQDRVDHELGDLAASAQEEGTMRTGDGVVAYDKPGTLNAAANGVQQDASGHFESVAHTRSTKSGTRT